MSRIIVKNLPLKADENAIRAHFGDKGIITDLKLMRKRQGESRRFAFIGYKTEEDAKEAVRYFNNTFLNSSRIDVSLAKAFGDEDLEKRKENLKRKRLQSTDLNDSKPSKQSKNELQSEDLQDKKFQEFLSVMQPQQRVAMWKNDSTERDLKPAVSNQVEVDHNDDEDINDLSKLEQIKEQNREDDDEAEEEKWVPQVDEETGIEKPGVEVSDMDWLKQKTSAAVDQDIDGDHVNDHMEDDHIEDDHMDQTDDVDTEMGSKNTESNRLFLRNLSYTVQQSELEDLFVKYGVIKQVHVPTDPRTDKPKGIAFVEFEDVEEAKEAIKDLDGKIFQGRILHILFGKPQRGYVLDEFDLKQMPLKKQKAIKRRMQAAKQQFSWNSLYMNLDTVLESAASKIGISKSEMMDPTSSNMAVKQALAESSVLESVQNYFKSKGVDLARFKPTKGLKLSDSIILAKNLPFNVSAQEIQDMFAQYGDVVRTLMPPDGGIAIVQFNLASSGRLAFQKLAFRRVGESILYLQKAPEGILDNFDNPDLDNSAQKQDAAAAGAAAAGKSGKSASDMLLPSQDLDTSNEPDIRTSVFIKNLNFSTPLTSLFKLLQPLPGFVTAVIKTKPDPANPGKQLSMGFGFAEFKALHDAETCIKGLQGHTLDGHDLQLKISSRGGDVPEKPRDVSTSKIIIKNIPFETTKKDISELFGTFGKLRSVRVPRKFNRQTRGFAFAEFATAGEAEHAMASLGGAHLLGRRLVMEYAQPDAEDPEAEISRMEAKVATQNDALSTQGSRLGGEKRSIDLEE